MASMPSREYIPLFMEFHTGGSRMEVLALPMLIWKLLPPVRSPPKEEPVIRNIDSSCFASCFAIRSSIRLRILGLCRSMPWFETRPSCRTNKNTLCVRMDAKAAFELARSADVIAGN